jgi:hypothetical protein
MFDSTAANNKSMDLTNASVNTWNDAILSNINSHSSTVGLAYSRLICDFQLRRHRIYETF